MNIEGEKMSLMQSNENRPDQDYITSGLEIQVNGGQTSFNIKDMISPRDDGARSIPTEEFNRLCELARKSSPQTVDFIFQDEYRTPCLEPREMPYDHTEEECWSENVHPIHRPVEILFESKGDKIHISYRTKTGPERNIPPDKLGKNQPDGISKLVIEFGEHIIYYSGNEKPQVIEIPLTGSLRDIPEEVKETYCAEAAVEENIRFILKNHAYNHDKFKIAGTEFEQEITYFSHPLDYMHSEHMRLTIMWIEPRQEWIAVLNDRDRSTGWYPSVLYKGPFSVDDYCADGIRRVNDIPDGVIDNKSIAKTSPEGLEKLAKDSRQVR